MLDFSKYEKSNRLEAVLMYHVIHNIGIVQGDEYEKLKKEYGFQDSSYDKEAVDRMNDDLMAKGLITEYFYPGAGAVGGGGKLKYIKGLGYCYTYSYRITYHPLANVAFSLEYNRWFDVDYDDTTKKFTPIKESEYLNSADFGKIYTYPDQEE